MEHSIHSERFLFCFALPVSCLDVKQGLDDSTFFCFLLVRVSSPVASPPPLMKILTVVLGETHDALVNSEHDLCASPNRCGGSALNHCLTVVLDSKLRIYINHRVCLAHCPIASAYSLLHVAH